MNHCPICMIGIHQWEIMCPKHFRMLPLPQRSNVKRLYANPRTRKGPTHLKACKLAIDTVQAMVDEVQKSIDAKIHAQRAHVSTPYRDD